MFLNQDKGNLSISTMFWNIMQTRLTYVTNCRLPFSSVIYFTLLRTEGVIIFSFLKLVFYSSSFIPWRCSERMRASFSFMWSLSPMIVWSSSLGENLLLGAVLPNASAMALIWWGAEPQQEPIKFMPISFASSAYLAISNLVRTNGSS